MFMRAMELAMEGLPWDEMEIYLDDIMIFSETIDKHTAQLDKVLRLEESNFTIEPKNANS